LLHAYAGSGKTATVAEFARWYSLTGGVNGPVLLKSFETPTPLPRVLDGIGEVFGPTPGNTLGPRSATSNPRTAVPRTMSPTPNGCSASSNKPSANIEHR
jgi:hypothetical protein